ncbi:serine/threonine protein kinase, partial [Thermoproteota archaeon]
MLFKKTLFGGLPQAANGAPSRPSLPPESILSDSRYLLLEKLGQGGMGSVYKAIRETSAKHRQSVAVKVLIDDDETMTSALEREALLISELNHDNIAGFVDSGHTKDGRPFIALEYIPGINLHQFMELHRMTPEALLRTDNAIHIPNKITAFILLMATRALDSAHTHEFADGSTGLINRDVSPDNLVIEKRNGFVKQIDFGIAATMDDIKKQKEMTEGDRNWSLVGKLLYMSPEMINQEELDNRADIYGLGLVGRELVTGFPQNECFEPEPTFQRMFSQIVLSQDRPFVPLDKIVCGKDDGLYGILSKATERNKEDRYQNAREMGIALEEYLYRGGVVGPTVTSLKSYTK